MAYRQLGDILVAQGAVGRDDIQAALRAQQADGHKSRLGDLLVESGKITSVALAAALAEQLRSLGQSVLVEVSTVDAYDREQLPITPAMVGDCLTAQVHLDRRWARYLGRARGPRSPTTAPGRCPPR